MQRLVPVAVSLALQSVAIVCSAQAGGEAGRNGVAVEAGYDYHVDLARISYSRDWERHWDVGRDVVLGAAWEVSVAGWMPHNPVGSNHDVTDFGITPAFRFTGRDRPPVAPYGEIGVGVHYISEHAIYRGRDMTTHFQFGDHVGVGVSLGEQHAWDLGVRFQHLSNAGLKHPNPGINFYQFRAGYHF